ncbi:hypothetical protein [Novosphingobium sp. M1R2S20]|uniref:Uncharacterized protein n=1 Tax=Novosphingobium rhizovicinum TaxID=3228928 RepID=A0ABV3RCT0_9SPHN
MSGKDIWNFLAVYGGVLMGIALLGLLTGSLMDDTDHLTALLFAATSTIIRAIREETHQ